MSKNGNVSILKFNVYFKIQMVQIKIKSKLPEITPSRDNIFWQMFSPAFFPPTPKLWSSFCISKYQSVLYILIQIAKMLSSCLFAFPPVDSLKVGIISLIILVNFMEVYQKSTQIIGLQPNELLWSKHLKIQIKKQDITSHPRSHPRVPIQSPLPQG